jgi:hypothetical protein
MRGDKGEKTAQCRKSAVASPNRDLSFLLNVLQKGNNLGCGNIRETDLSNAAFPVLSHEPEKQTPSISIR